MYIYIYFDVLLCLMSYSYKIFLNVFPNFRTFAFVTLILHLAINHNDNLLHVDVIQIRVYQHSWCIEGI